MKLFSSELFRPLFRSGRISDESARDAVRTIETALADLIRRLQALAIDVFTSTLAGIVPASGGGTSNFLRADGSWSVPPGTTTPPSGTGFVHVTAGAYDASAELTGDVSAAAGGVTAIGNDKVTYAKMQNVSATSRFLGRITAGAGDPEELTGTQATTLLDVVTSVLKGLAPASGGGTTNFLRADATWATPSGTATLGLALWGDGFDGDLTFDGTSTVTLGDGTTLVPATAVYTLARDIFPHNMTVNANDGSGHTVRIKVAGFRIIGSATGTLTNNGQIDANGADASGQTGGAGASAGIVGGGLAGANGGNTAGGGTGTSQAASSGITPWCIANSTGLGGTSGNPGTNGNVNYRGGGGGSYTAGAAGGSSGNSTTRAASDGGPDPFAIMRGAPQRTNSTLWGGGTGGGGGAGSGVGGGGGGGGGMLVINYPTITGSGVLWAHGGNGAAGVSGNGGGGGGGGGGTVQAIYWTRSGNVATATGGTHGAGLGTGQIGGDGHDGIARTYNLSGDGT